MGKQENSQVENENIKVSGPIPTGINLNQNEVYYKNKRGFKRLGFSGGFGDPYDRVKNTLKIFGLVAAVVLVIIGGTQIYRRVVKVYNYTIIESGFNMNQGTIFDGENTLYVSFDTRYIEDDVIIDVLWYALEDDSVLCEESLIVGTDSLRSTCYKYNWAEGRYKIAIEIDGDQISSKKFKVE